MTEPIRLIPLVCPKCQTPVPAQPDEVAWVCEQCAQGMLLSDEKGVETLEIFFSASIPQNGTGRPFWVTQGSVTAISRQTYRGGNDREMNEFWSAPHLFYIPAYAVKIDDLLAEGSKLLRNPVGMNRGGVTRFQPVVLAPDGIKAVAEFIVMSLEADRADKLKELKFDLKLARAQLWVLP
jgi:hypothetical protein